MSAAQPQQTPQCHWRPLPQLGRAGEGSAPGTGAKHHVCGLARMPLSKPSAKPELHR